MGIGSRNRGGQDMLGHTLRKREKQRSQWHYSVGVQRSKHQELCCPRAGKDGHASSRRERENSLFLPFLFNPGPQWIGLIPNTLVELSFLLRLLI